MTKKRKQQYNILVAYCNAHPACWKSGCVFSDGTPGSCKMEPRKGRKSYKYLIDHIVEKEISKRGRYWHDTQEQMGLGVQVDETEAEIKTGGTRLEQLKNYTVDEMADFLIDHCDGCQVCSRKHYDSCHDLDGGCIRYVKEWLESEGEIDGVL